MEKTPQTNQKWIAITNLNQLVTTVVVNLSAECWAMMLLGRNLSGHVYMSFLGCISTSQTWLCLSSLIESLWGNVTPVMQMENRNWMPGSRTRLNPCLGCADQIGWENTHPAIHTYGSSCIWKCTNESEHRNIKFLFGDCTGAAWRIDPVFLISC